MNDLQIELQGVLYELESQMGGYAAVEEVRDKIAAELGEPPMGRDSNYFTAFANSDFERWAMPAVPDDEELRRVYVQPEDPNVIYASKWKRTIDGISGQLIEMRRANCGLGCKCATEVRLVRGVFGELS